MDLVGTENNRSNSTPSLMGWRIQIWIGIGEYNFSACFMQWCGLTAFSSSGLQPPHLQQQQELGMEFKAGFYKFWRNGKGRATDPGPSSSRKEEFNTNTCTCDMCTYHSCIFMIDAHRCTSMCTAGCAYFGVGGLHRFSPGGGSHKYFWSLSAHILQPINQIFGDVQRS